MVRLGLGRAGEEAAGHDLFERSVKWLRGPEANNACGKSSWSRGREAGCSGSSRRKAYGRH